MPPARTLDHDVDRLVTTIESVDPFQSFALERFVVPTSTFSRHLGKRTLHDALVVLRFERVPHKG